MAKKFNGEIISADSRQVYKYMDIGTGKDLTKNAEWLTPDAKFSLGNLPTYRLDGNLGFYFMNGINVWGYDLVSPKTEFSVSQYAKIAAAIIQAVSSRQKTPILVGGTGLYIRALVDSIATINIPRDILLRQKLEKKSADELYKILSKMDLTKADSMNDSDRKNPRRLIRAIEVAWFNRLPTEFLDNPNKKKEWDLLMIGLKCPEKILEERIKARVKKRIKDGIVDEIKLLKKRGVSWRHQAMTSLGYRQWQEYFDGKKTAGEVESKWIRDEIKYARRQLGWLKRDSRIVWFDVSSPGYLQAIEKLVKKWYIRDKDKGSQIN